MKSCGLAGHRYREAFRRASEVFDTRPVVSEQVQSLGAKFVEIDLGDTGQTDQGYAKELTPEQVEMQREGKKPSSASLMW